MMAKITNKPIEMFSVVAFLSLFLAILPAIVSAAPPARELPKSVAIGTLPKGSFFNILGSAVAKIITSHTPMTAVDRPYTGFQIYIPLTNKGSVDISIGGYNEYSFAYRGLEHYKEKCNNLRLICGGNTLLVGYVARPDSGIKTIRDLKGKRVALDLTSKNLVWRPLGLMRAAGLDPEKDVTLVPAAGVVASLGLLMEGRADASWSAVGTAKNKELYAKFGGLTWVSVVESYDDAGARWIREKAFGEDVAFVKAGIVPEAKNDFWFIKSINVLSTHKGMSDEAVYLITKAIWENKDELIAIHPGFKTWHANMITEIGVLPYHPGAIRFYREGGAWPDKMEIIQRKALAE